jgi:hypothetical protein
VLRSTEVYPEFSDLFFLEFACLVRLLPNRFSFTPGMLGRGVRNKKKIATRLVRCLFCRLRVGCWVVGYALSCGSPTCCFFFASTFIVDASRAGLCGAP